MSTNGHTATFNDPPSSVLTPRDRLLERLSDPRTVDSLNTLLDKADVIAFSVQALDGLLRRSNEVIESLSDTVSDLKQIAPNGDTATLIGKLPQLAKTGVQLAEATETPAFNNLVKSGLLEQLGDPQTIASLKTLLDKMEMISFSVVMIDGFIHRIDEVMEAIATSVSELRAVAPGATGGSIVNIVSQTLPQLAQAGSAFSKSGIVEKIPELSKAGVDLANSGMLNKFDELTRTLVQLVESGISARKRSRCWPTRARRWPTRSRKRSRRSPRPSAW